MRQPARAAVDSLESRTLFAVSLDAAGFTVVTPGDGDRVIYVSSSRGSDNNNGLTPVTAFKTIAAAKAVIRAGTGDQMLLKRGDIFYETIGSWTKGGRSASEPLVIGAFGVGNRPIVATGKSTAITTGTSGIRVVNHLVIQGIKFWSHHRDPSSGSFAGASGGNEGLRLLAGTNNLLVEDIEVDSYTTNITVAGFQAPASNIRIRRSVIVDAYNTEGHAQGLYVDNVSGFTLEENVFDHNGWNASVSGAGRTQYNHNIYIKETVGNFVARGNLSSNASSHGMQARAGGVVENNVFLDNPLHMSFGLVNGGTAKPGGVTGRVSNNVFQGGGTIGTLVRGWALELGNVASGTVSGNVFTDAVDNGGAAISLNVMAGLTNTSSAVGVNNLLIENNVIYDWSRNFFITEALVVGGSGATGLKNVTFRNNDIQNSQKTTMMFVGADFNTNEIHLSGNRYNSPAGTALVNIGGPATKWYQWAPGRDFNSAERYVTYPGGARDLDGFGAAEGVGSSDGWVSAARKQTVTSWNDDLLGSAAATWVRTGYGLTGSIPQSPPSPPPPPATGAVQLRPIADAYVRDGSYASKNYGSISELEVRKSGVLGNSRMTYLKFDLSNVSTINSAVLSLTGKALQSGSLPMQVFAAASNTWSPTTITWNNAPGTTGSAIASFNANVSGTTVKTYTANLTSYLKARKAAGATDVSLVILSPTVSTTAGQFKASEGGLTGPTITIS